MAAPAHIRPPEAVRTVLQTLWGNGHAAYLVGGGVRDELLGLTVRDWDVATDARPERILELFPRGRYENRFGTVNVPGPSEDDDVEVTTFRRDHVYADHRRPDTVTFTDDLLEDLARRDFTVNAIAWGIPGRSLGDHAVIEPEWVDPTGGLADLDARVLRAVGNPEVRFDEDGLRLLRAARLASQLRFEIEPATARGMTSTSTTIRWVSNERVGEELRRMLEADQPSRAFEILAATSVLDHALPDLAAQRGIPQDKAPGMDLWAHCMATLDAAAHIQPDWQFRLAALLHDIGKPSTFADGHFIGHDEEGARLTEALMLRLALPRRDVARVAALVRQHMFSYEPRWSGAAVRRFIRRVGRDRIDELIDLRAADNVGSGQPADAGHLDELRWRVRAELDAGAPLSLADLAVDGDDLMVELGLSSGPQVGVLLEWLLGEAIADPAVNDRATLLERGREWLASNGPHA